MLDIQNRGKNVPLLFIVPDEFSAHHMTELEQTIKPDQENNVHF